jgi:flagellar secretion chaperone FliS
MYGNHGIRAYRETDIASISKEKMIVLLYEKMLEHFEAAGVAAEARNRREMTTRLNSAQRIVVELRNALDHQVGGDIARNLCALYDFVFLEILSMLVDQDPLHATNSRRILEPLLASWRQIPPGTADRLRHEQSQPAGPKAAYDQEDGQEDRLLVPAGVPRDGEVPADIGRRVSFSA